MVSPTGASRRRATSSRGDSTRHPIPLSVETVLERTSSGDHPIEPGVAREVDAVRTGDERRVLPVRETPDLLAGARVERVRAALQRREVDEIAEHGRRPRDRPVRLELPLDVA